MAGRWSCASAGDLVDLLASLSQKSVTPMQNGSRDTEMNTGFGGIGGLVDLQTTIAGFEMTLETLVDISSSIKRLDDRLAALNPELPRIGAAVEGGQSISGSFSAMLAAYQEAFAAMAAAARSAALLGLGEKPVVLNLQNNHQAQPAAQVAAPQPAIEVVSAPPVAQAAPAPEAVSEPAPQPTAPPAPEVAPAAPAAVAAPQAPAPKAPAPAGDLKPVGAIASQRFSAIAPSGKQLKSEAEMMKPLKPIEMPNAEHQIGPMITQGMGVVYAHSTEVKRHWPGARDSKATIEAPIPNDPWRLLDFDGTIFCVGEEKVTVVSGGDLHKEGTFAGKHVNQTHTASTWAGLVSNGGNLSVVLRDKHGRPVGEAVPVGNAGDARTFMATSGEAVYVAFGTGEMFRVEGGGLQALPKLDKGSIVGMGVDERGLVVTSESASGVVLTVLDPVGNVRAQSQVVAGSISHPPVLLNDRAYLVDDSKSEVVTLALHDLSVLSRTVIEGIVRVGRLIGLQEDAGTTLAIMAAEKDGRPTDVYLHSVESGKTAKICRLGATKGEIAYADGHIAVSSTSSMQNMVQVFSVYATAAVGAKAA